MCSSNNPKNIVMGHVRSSKNTKNKQNFNYNEIKKERKLYTSFDLGLSYLPCFILFLDTILRCYSLLKIFIYHIKQNNLNTTYISSL